MDLISQFQPLIERTAGGTIDIDFTYDDQVCNARIDSTQAELAIINILLNARDAMPGGGTIKIEVKGRTVDAGDKGFGELKPGHYVMISITDQGTGMPEEIRARAMEPFFTTKEQGKGTGLGLSMAYGFMKQSGGALSIYSEEGLGTTVRMVFPCENSKPEPVGSRPPRSTPDGRYFVVKGRLWRLADPSLPEAKKSALVSELMRARRAVRTAKQAGDEQAEAAAHRDVDAAKQALGERGAVWWGNGDPDLNRHMVKNTSYASWFAGLKANRGKRSA